MSFEERFDEVFNQSGSEDFDREEVLEFIQNQLAAPVFTLAVSIQGQRSPTLSSNLPGNDPNALEQMADAVAMVETQLRKQATQALRSQLESQQHLPAPEEE